MIENDNSSQFQSSQTEDTFQKIFQASPDGYIISRMADGKILQVNRSAEVIFGYSAEEMLGRTSIELGLIADLKERERAINILKENGFLRDFHMYVIRKSGERRLVSLAIEMVKLMSGQCMVTSVRDLTNHKRVEDEAIARAIELETILENITDGVIVYDNEGKIVRTNTAALEILKYPSNDLKSTISERVSERYGFWSETGEKLKAEDMPAMRALKKGEKIKNMITKIQGAGDLRWVNVSAVPLISSGIQIGAVATISDITEKKKAEEALQKSEHQFRSLLTATSEVLYRMSPDWSTMLQLNGHNFLVDTENENPDWLQEYIHPDDQSNVMAAINEAIKNKSIFELEHRVRQADGSWGWTYSHAVPLLNTDGKIIEWFGAASDFTKRKQAEEALTIREAQLDAFFANSPAILNLVDENFCYINTDKLTPTYYGLNRDTIKGKCVKDLSKDFIEQTGKVMQHIIETGELVLNEQFQAPVPGRSGEMAYWSTSMFRVPLGNKKWGVGVISLEITDIKHAEQELIKAYEQYDLLFNSIEEGFAHYQAVYDETGRLDDLLVLDINPAGAALSGVSREKQIGKRWKEVWTGIEDYLFDIYRKVDQSGELINFEHFSGITQQWYSNNIKKIDNGHFAVTFFNITERKVMEDALRKSEENYRQLADSMPQIVWTTDENGKIDYFNQKWYDYTGLTVHESFNSKSREIFHPDDIEDVLSVWKKAYETTQPLETKVRMKWKGGKYYWHLSRVIPIKDSNGKIIRWIGTATNIDEMKCTEERLEKTLTELEKSNKELEQFAYVASHDLQEPIRMISNYTQLLSMTYSGFDDKAAEYMGFIVEGSKRMLQQINDFLQFSRVSKRGEEFVVIDINKIVKEALRDLQFAIENSGAIINYNDLPVLKADPFQMKQLFQNLISNSIKYRSNEKPVIEIKSHKEDKIWVFSIKDNGIGIDPKYFEKIFVLFQRLHSDRQKYPGTGIGLALSKKIVERHRGKIWVESAEGKGSTFYFSIPAERIR